MSTHDELVAYVEQTLTDPETDPPPGVSGRSEAYTEDDGCTYVPVYLTQPRPHRTDIHDPSCERC